MKKVLLQLSLVFTSGTLLAQPGAFDPTFNGGNLASTDMWASYLKIVSSGNETAWINRNNGTMAPVPPFGQSNGVFGVLTNDPGAGTYSMSTTHSVAFPSDQYKEITDFDLTSSGKVVITGYMRTDYNTPNYGAFVGRVDPATGMLENSFNGGNYYTLQSTGTFMSHQVEVQSDDKILIAGWETLQNFFIRRLNADGTIDAGFGNTANAGVTNFTVIGSGTKEVKDMKIQVDGKILIAGWDTDGTNIKGFVARFNSSGFADNTFGTNGIVLIDYGFPNSYVESIDLTASGEIIVAGYKNDSSMGSYGILTKLTTAGVIAGGNEFSTNSEFSKVRALSNGKILVGGNYYGTSMTTALFVMYNADCTTDNTFGSSGNGQASFSNNGLGSGIWVKDFDIQPDGKVIFMVATSGTFQSGAYAGRMLMSSSGAGIEDQELEQISVYPNPASETIHIQITEPTEVTVTDINGKELFKASLSSAYELNVSELTNGIYFIRTTDGQTVKFIKE